MRALKTISIFYFSVLFCTSEISAQWQWAVGALHGVEGTGLTTDVNGNIFAIGVNYGNYSIFGTDTIPQVGSGVGGSAEGIMLKIIPIFVTTLILNRHF